MPALKLFVGDAAQVLQDMESNSIDLCMTSPPYWALRDYGKSGQIGLEPNFDEYVDRIACVCAQVMRILKPSGSFYLNLGDTYLGDRGLKSMSVPKPFKPQTKRVRRKSLAGIPWRVAIALMDGGWILRNDIIWHKPNHMPASVKDRLSNSYEHLFHFVKTERYYYDLDAIREPHKDASIQRMLRAVQEGKPKVTKYSPGADKGKGVQGGRYFYPTWAKDYHELRKTEILSKITHGKINHGMYKGGVYKGIAQHPLGKNPGDVVSHERPIRAADVARDLLRNRTGGLVYRPDRPPMQNNPLGRNPSDFWSVTTGSFRGAHFAVYPEKLCVRPILSSSPEKVCSKCGLPARKVSQGRSAKPFNVRLRDGKSGKLQKKWGGMVNATEKETQSYDEQNYKVRSSERVVWPGCSCNATFRPATVLDPFAGSGTTLKVAAQNGRNAIGIEINPDYVEVARQRLGVLNALQVINCGAPA